MYRSYSPRPSYSRSYSKTIRYSTNYSKPYRSQLTLYKSYPAKQKTKIIYRDNHHYYNSSSGNNDMLTGMVVEHMLSQPAPQMYPPESVQVIQPEVSQQVPITQSVVQPQHGIGVFGTFVLSVIVFGIGVYIYNKLKSSK